MKPYSDSKTPYLTFFVILLITLFILISAVPITAYADAEYDYDANVISAIVVNETRDMVLYEKAADEKVYPASTTKVLMALVVANSIEDGAYSLDDTFAAYDELYFDIPWDGSTENIQAGEVMTVRDYLHCALLSSANEACNALAYFDSGSNEAFVAKMNAKAKELGCTNSHFSDAHGIYHDDHYTTARDMYLIFSAVLNDPIAGEIVSTLEYTVPATNKSEERELENTNMLIRPDSRLYYEYALGGKTGFTEEAGLCLVSAAEKDGDRLICIIMGADVGELEDGTSVPGSFLEAKNLYEWCYSEYGDQPVLSTTLSMGSIQVKYGKDADSVDTVASKDVTYYMSRSDFENKVTYEIKLKRNVIGAPIHEGDKLGTIDAIYNGELIGSAKLLSAGDVKLSLGKFLKESTEVKIILFFALIILLSLIFKKILVKK